MNGPTGLIVGAARGNVKLSIHRVHGTFQSQFNCFSPTNMQVLFGQCIVIQIFQPIYCQLMFA